MGVTEDVANATITQTDKFRADYYKYYTHGNYWTNPVNYDLTINSAKVGIEDSVKMIEEYLIIKGFIIGIAKIIPGVSGSLVALNLG